VEIKREERSEEEKKERNPQVENDVILGACLKHGIHLDHVWMIESSQDLDHFLSRLFSPVSPRLARQRQDTRKSRHFVILGTGLVPNIKHLPGLFFFEFFGIERHSPVTKSEEDVARVSRAVCAQTPTRARDKDANGLPSVEKKRDGHALIDPDVQGEREFGFFSQVLFEVETTRVAESLGL